MITYKKNESNIHLTLKDEFKENLLDLTKKQNWIGLDNTSISCDFNRSSITKFKDEVWDFRIYKVGTETTLINFGFKENDISPQLIRELKTVALAYIFHSRHAYRISTVRLKIDCLKKLVRALNQEKIFTFNGLNINHIKKLIKKEIYTPLEIDLAPLNSLSDLADFLPFSVSLEERLTLKKLRVKQPSKEQHPVIPFRIYLSALQTYISEIQYWHQYKDQLEHAVKIAFEYEREQSDKLIKKLRHGKCDIGQIFNKSDKNFQNFTSALKKFNVPLIDYEKSETWNKLWDKHFPHIRTDYYEKFPAIKIENEYFDSPNKIKNFCRNLDTRCRYVVLCLSGMRSNELLQIVPEIGAQVITLDGVDIHIFHTKQQKITLGYQGHDDVYVTTKNGHLAYDLLNALNSPIRQWHKDNGLKPWFLNTFTHFRQPRSVHRSGHVLISLNKLFTLKNQKFSVELDANDIEMLRRSDPEKTFSIGDKWNLTPHQLRRSLAYYLVGMHLADYPQLKQQFSHYSIAMTMYYSRNSSSFSKMYSDLEQEKIRQQANLLSNISLKAKLGHNLGGGYGKFLYQQDFNDRDMSSKYFEKEIKSGRKHIHAIAPGMYCINRACSMRIGIEFPECVDCDWSIIESTAYAQAVRQESINILEVLSIEGQLSDDIYEFHKIRIQAAEKIMQSMNLNFEPYKIMTVPRDQL
ncbi:MAG: hypothetical protein QM652_13045 [Legionella sp.]|uniref:hypothetical protein n=1 Tax=Legionella sp. TaxID=459 RepID=UPI0039E60A20